MPHIAKRAWLLTLVSGALQAVIFPSINLYVLCWFAFTPLLLAMLQTRQKNGGELIPATPKQAFFLAWVTGVIWSAGTCYWIYHVMHWYGGLDTVTSFAIVVLFCLILALHHGLFGLLFAWVARSKDGSSAPIRAIMLAPFLWVAVEFFRTKITGFPWDLLGTVQVDNIPLTRIATVTGVYGLSFEILLVNAAFAAGLMMHARARRNILAATIVVTLVVQLGLIVQPPPLAATETARLVQQNIPILTSDEWTRPYFDTTVASLARASLSDRDGNDPNAPRPNLIIWPESPAPFFISDDLFRAEVSKLAQASQAYVITGSLAPVRNNYDDGLYNSAALIAPDGTWAARYDKIHLVPFGEYVPFGPLLSFAHKLTREVGNFVPGTQRNVFHVDGYSVGTFICYESIFPGEIRQFANNGANVFVNISNDGWFGNYGAPQQHLNQARMRAIENDRWLLRSTNTGITASIDPYGRIVDVAQRNVRATLDAPFSVVKSTTFYTRHGDWFAWACAIITVVALIWRFQFFRRRSA